MHEQQSKLAEISLFQDSKKKEKEKSRKNASSSSESASPRREFTAHFKACVASAREDVSKRRKDALIARLGGTAVTSLARYANIGMIAWPLPVQIKILCS